MNRFLILLITWVAFIFMFTMNVLANSLPLNGYKTGDLSALYPNRFVPDGFTFSIWGIIYLALLVFTGYANRIIFWLPDVDKRVQRIKAILPLFWLSCFLNGSWILAWHYLQLPLSLMIMVLLLMVLLGIFKVITKHRAAPRRQDHLLVELPFLIYLGWISVAIIANTTALLVHNGWQGWGISEVAWSIIMMGVATLAGLYMSVKWNRPSYTLVIVWAIWGIYRGQGNDAPVLGYLAIAFLLICIVFATRELLNPKRGWKPV